MAISSLTAWSCKETVLQEDTAQDTFTGIQALAVPQVNSAVVAPIAKDFIIQKLEKPDPNGNTLLFMAVLSREDSQLSNVRSFPIKAGDTEIKLRDDGTEGDERAGDFVFSAFVKEDINRLGENLKRKNVELARTEQTITHFVGRSMLKTRSSLIDLDAFMANKAVSLGANIAIQAVIPDVFKPLKENSLVINNLGVVQDPIRTFNPCVGTGNPNGAWTLKKLMTNMVGTSATITTADAFVKNWIDTELFEKKPMVSSGDVTTVTGLNGATTIRDNLTNPASSKRKFIAAWLKNSNIPNPTSQSSIDNWKTLLVNKLEFLPVRLLAIVNRLDLRGNFGYTGSSNSGGEGRFVFCFMDSNSGCTSSNNGPGTMTIILEYAIPIRSCAPLKEYAQKWYNLKNLQVGSATYNSTLESITKVFTDAGAGTPLGKPNGSALNHLRSNEFIMAPWNIRDFEILLGTTKLTLVHPEKEPMREANSAPGGLPLATKVTALVNFANLNVNNITTDRPYSIDGVIKGVDAQIPSPSYFWNPTTVTGTRINNDLARHKLSLNTCSGCHAGETKTAFTHVSPTDFGVPAKLSSFLLGAIGNPTAQFSVTDPAGRPAGNPTVRGFNDLLRRANDLETLVSSSCGGNGSVFDLALTLSFQPLNTTH